MNIKVFILLLSFILTSWSLFGQAPKNWYLLDQSKDGFPGVSADRAYDELLKGKKADTVIVAIIDSGVESGHDGLAPRMWINPNEIANNKTDDDGNGYIDDTYGWNFIGGPTGNVSGDSYEVTRLYAKYRKKYGDVDPATLSKKETEEYEKYLSYKEEVETERAKAKSQFDMMMNTLTTISSAMVQLEEEFKGDKTFNLENVQALEPGENSSLAMGKSFAIQVLGSGLEVESFQEFKEMIMSQFPEQMKYFKNKAEIGYNPDFDPRYIVGDNYEDSSEQYYGNADSEGPDAMHGTHVAGIVGAKAHDGDDIYGVARHVKLMSVRAVPDGDERDKDVANAIRYAVDNGASIINMSFGKAHSWDKQVVDEAVKYAEKNDVLLVHAAGNAAQNNDIENNFPNPYFEKKGWFRPKRAKNWIEVGALAPSVGEQMVAPFSNYGQTTVDIFAPGAEIYSTVPDNSYQYLQGTSMASPTVAGVAAILRSHFPTLTARQVKEIIMESAVPVTQKVMKPGTKDLVSFEELCVTGGYINAYEAVRLAEKTKGKKKIKNKPSSGARNNSASNGTRT